LLTFSRGSLIISALLAPARRIERS